MIENRGSRRLRERSLLSLPVSVHCREGDDHEWVEMSRLIDASPFGARLTISRPTEGGRLLQLVMQMPRHLRCFDHEEEEYRTWALVRHIQHLPQSDERSPRFEIGVAFVGKRLPATVATDPARRYDIASNPGEHDWWEVRERPNLDELNDARERREERRFAITTDVFIEVYDAEGRVYRTEQAKTENISHRGMAVVTDLNLNRGRYVRLRSPLYNIAVIAAVRRLRRGADGNKHLHLEFVDQRWPQLEEE
jgi:hypothetical protein